MQYFQVLPFIRKLKKIQGCNYGISIKLAGNPVNCNFIKYTSFFENIIQKCPRFDELNRMV